MGDLRLTSRIFESSSAGFDGLKLISSISFSASHPVPLIGWPIEFDMDVALSFEFYATTLVSSGPDDR